MTQTTGITLVQGTVPRRVSGTDLFPYFDKFLVTMGTKFVRPEKFQFMEKWQNRNFGYEIIISVKNTKCIL